MRRHSSPGLTLYRLENQRDGLRDPSVGSYLALEVLPAARGEAIIASAPVSLGSAPLPRDPTFDKHPLESWIERSLFDLQNVGSPLLDSVGNCESVHLAPPSQRLEDEHVERTGRDFVPLSVRRHNIDSLCDVT